MRLAALIAAFVILFSALAFATDGTNVTACYDTPMCIADGNLTEYSKVLYDSDFLSFNTSITFTSKGSYILYAVAYSSANSTKVNSTSITITSYAKNHTIPLCSDWGTGDVFCVNATTWASQIMYDNGSYFESFYNVEVAAGVNVPSNWTFFAFSNSNINSTEVNSDSITVSIVSFLFVSTEIITPANITYNITNITIDINSVGDELNSCWYSLDGGTNITYTCNTTFSTNFTNGAHKITAFANDTTTEASDSISFVIDNIAPKIYLDSPQNQSYNITDIGLNYTIVDENPTNSWYSLNSGTNITLNGNTTITAIEGANYLAIFVNDSANNINSVNVSFFVDSVEPIVTIELPQNTTYISKSITFNFSVYDENEYTTWYSLNSGANITIAENTTLNCIEGPNTLVLYAEDILGNTGFDSVSFTIMIAPQFFNITFSPSEYLNYSPSIVLEWNSTWADDNPDNVSLAIISNNTKLSECTQEFANSSICKGTGNYKVINITSEVYDGDWSTYADFSQKTGQLLSNYSVPPYATRANLTLKYGDGGIEYNASMVVPDSCMLDYVYLKIEQVCVSACTGIGFPVFKLNVTCMNSSDYEVLGTFLDTEGYISVYEEKIVWDKNYLEELFDFNSSTQMFSFSNDILGADNYTYFWCGTDGLNNKNCTGNYTFKISKHDTFTSLFINGSESNRTMIWPSGLNISAYNTNSTLQLEFDGTVVVNPYLIGNYSVGEYNFTARSLGNTNYSESSVTWFVNITPYQSKSNLSLNGNQSNISITYGEYINATKIMDNFYSSYLYLNGTNISEHELYLLGVGIWNFTAFVETNINQTGSSVTWYANVSKQPTSMQIFINNSNSTGQELVRTDFINVTIYLLNQTGSLLGSPLVFYYYNNITGAFEFVQSNNNTKIYNNTNFTYLPNDGNYLFGGIFNGTDNYTYSAINLSAYLYSLNITLYVNTTCWANFTYSKVNITNNTQKRIQPYGQNNSCGIFFVRLENSSSRNATVTIKLNATASTWRVRIGNSSNYTLASNITTTYTQIIDTILIGQSIPLWHWVDLYSPAPGTKIIYDIIVKGTKHA